MKNTKNNEQDKFLWKCPYCGYVMTDEKLQSCEFDYGCPKCKMPLGDYELVQWTLSQ